MEFGNDQTLADRQAMAAGVDWPAVMSKSQYGDYRRSRFGRGSPPMVTKWIKQEKITPPALRADGKIDRAAADRQLADRLDPARSNAADLDDDDFDDPIIDDDPPAAPATPPINAPNMGSAGSSYNDERIAYTRAQRRLKEMEIAEREGRLIVAADVEAAQFDMARMVRDRLLSLASEVAGALVGHDEREIRARLRDALAEKLVAISEEIETAADNVPSGE